MNLSELNEVVSVIWTDGETEDAAKYTLDAVWVY
jgi:hypothetical protein